MSGRHNLVENIYFVCCYSSSRLRLVLFFLTFESTIFLKFIVGDSVVLKVLKVFFCADSFLLTPLNSNRSIEGYILYVFHFFYFYFQGGNITSEYVNYYILCFLSTRCTFIAVSKP